MCGFVGVFGPENNVSEIEVRAIGSSAGHRGPDDHGYWSDDSWQVYFNRLSIVELSKAGRQPMSIPGGKWVVVFNGEIYNHSDIRGRLPAYDYQGTSDTETICHAIEAWGVDRTIRSLNGMFAIAAYDRSERRLVLARDCAGIKPLFYSVEARPIWCASQFDQVARGVGWSNLTLDRSAMRDFLQLGYMPAPETIYAEIKQVQPGEIVSFDHRNRMSSRRYYSLPPFGPMGDTVVSQSNGRFAKAMAETVKSQLVSDVPIGCFISSGIDSALVSGFASRSRKEIKTFTIGVDGSHVDERPRAAEYSRAMRLENLSTTITADEILGAVDESIRMMGEPFGDHSSIPTFLITKSAKAHNTVMLSGDGGDELFWGYTRWNTYLENYSRFKIPRRLRRVQRYLSRNNNGKLAYGPGVIETPGEWVLNGQSYNKPLDMDRLMPGSENSETIRALFDFSHGRDQLEFRNWLRWNEYYGHLQKVLTKVDRMSMANSLEVRVPFLDKRIIEFAWNSESLYGQEHLINKDLLKRELEAFVPASTINHEKLGFDIPIDDWLKGPLKAAVQDKLLGSKLYGSEFLDEKAVRSYVDKYYRGANFNSGGIWVLYNWQKWSEFVTNSK